MDLAVPVACGATRDPAPADEGARLPFRDQRRPLPDPVCCAGGSSPPRPLRILLARNRRPSEYSARVAAGARTGALRLAGLPSGAQLAVFHVLRDLGGLDEPRLDKLMTTWLLELGTKQRRAA